MRRRMRSGREATSEAYVHGGIEGVEGLVRFLSCFAGFVGGARYPHIVLSFTYMMMVSVV